MAVHPLRTKDLLELAMLLHEEIDRLPDKYRAPIVLCYFDGLSHDQAARQLRWPVGTVRSRLCAVEAASQPVLCAGLARR